MFKDNRWKLALGYNLACLHSCNLFLHLCSLACTVLNKKKKKTPLDQSTFHRKIEAIVI